MRFWHCEPSALLPPVNLSPGLSPSVFFFKPQFTVCEHHEVRSLKQRIFFIYVVEPFSSKIYILKMTFFEEIMAPKHVYFPLHKFQIWICLRIVTADFPDMTFFDSGLRCT